jgi:hypothetical protein
VIRLWVTRNRPQVAIKMVAKQGCKMEAISGYMVVRSGGEYSDAYHCNERFYLDRSEAEAWIEVQREKSRVWNKFVSLCPKHPYSTDRIRFEEQADNLFPPGTPNRRRLIADKMREMQEECSAAWKIEILKICEANFPTLIERVRMKSWLNEESEETDYEIEEIEIPVGSRLYRILSGE